MLGPVKRRLAITLVGSACFVWVACRDNPALAQQSTTPFDEARFLAFAASSSEFQRRAATIAASRDTRPQVKEFAASMLRFREEHSRRLRDIVSAAGSANSTAELEPEHQVVLDNLEPLDYLALSRRYMEVQVQALQQEERGYEVAARAGSSAVRQLAEAFLPEIHRTREEAKQALNSVAP